MKISCSIRSGPRTPIAELVGVIVLFDRNGNAAGQGVEVLRIVTGEPLCLSWVSTA